MTSENKPTQQDRVEQHGGDDGTISEASATPVQGRAVVRRHMMSRRKAIAIGLALIPVVIALILLRPNATVTPDVSGPAGERVATVPSPQSGDVPNRAAPTGAPIGFDDRITPGECVDLDRTQDALVDLYRADCGEASLALDAIQPRCSSRGVTVRRGFLALCFAWLVQPGDCVNLTEYVIVPCAGPPAPEKATGPIVRIILTISGESTGRRCPNVGQYLVAGRNVNRGVACYEDHENIVPSSRTAPSALMSSATATPGWGWTTR